MPALILISNGDRGWTGHTGWRGQDRRRRSPSADQGRSRPRWRRIESTVRCSSPVRTPGRRPTRPPSDWAGRGCSTRSSPRAITTATAAWPAGSPPGSLPSARKIERWLLRRHDPEIPADRVRAQRRPTTWRAGWSRALAASRPRREARRGSVADRSVRRPTGADRGSGPAGWPARLQRRRLAPDAADLPSHSGIPTVLSMVHGDVREERRVLEEEAEGRPTSCRSTWAMPGSTATSWTGCTGAGSGSWSSPTASSSRRSTSPRRWCDHGTPRDRVRVIPYAADCGRFRPLSTQGSRRVLHVPLRRRDQPAEGDQVPARGVAADPPARLAAPAPGSPAPRASVRSGRISTRSNPWDGSAIRDARRGWRRPTSSCSRRSSRARPS